MTICEFIREQLSLGVGSCMFVSGVPGTGKTASIRAVAKTLMAELEARELVDFRFVEINGMALTTPPHLYTELWQAVRETQGKKATPAHALELLRKRFTTPSPRYMDPVVYVVVCGVECVWLFWVVDVVGVDVFDVVSVLSDVQLWPDIPVFGAVNALQCILRRTALI